MSQAPKSTEALLQLGAVMRQAVKIKDRRYLFRSYRRCFVGQDAVAWMVASGAAADSAEAVRLGNEMMGLGLFHHVMYEHLFEDDYLFYRFTEDDPVDKDKDGAQLPQPSAAAAAAAGGTAADVGSGGGGGGSQPLRRTGSADDTSGPVVGIGDAARAPDAGLRQTTSQQPPSLSAVDARAAGATTAPAASSPAAAAPPTGDAKGSQPAASSSGPRPLATTMLLGDRFLLSEPRQDKGRQVVLGHLQELQGRVAHMQQAAEAQRSITEILVSEVSALKGEVAHLRSRLDGASAQLQAASAEAAVVCRQMAGLRLLALGLSTCLLQQALNAWMGPHGVYGSDAVGAFFAHSTPIWSVALAAMMVVLALKVLLPPARASRGVLRAAPASASPGTRRSSLGDLPAPGADAQAAGGKAAMDSRRSGSGTAQVHGKADGEPAAATVVHASAVAGGELSGPAGGSGATLRGTQRVRWDDVSGGRTAFDGAVTSSSDAVSCGTRSDGGAAAADGSHGSRDNLARSSADTARRYTEVVRQLTAPVRLHLPGKRRLDREAVEAQLRSLSQSQAAVAGCQAALAASGPSLRPQSGTITSQPVCTTEFEGLAASSGAAERLLMASGGGDLGEAPAAAAAPSDGAATVAAVADAAAKSAACTEPVVAAAAVRAAKWTVVPRPSDFEGWPDAPILLAFHTGVVPEHALEATQEQLYGRSGGDGDGSLRGTSDTQVKAKPLDQASSAPDPSLGVMTGDATVTGAADTAAASGTLPVQRDVSDATVYGDCDGGGDAADAYADGGDSVAEPPQPATPVASSDAGAPRSLPLPNPGLVRLAANGVRPIRIETELFSGELMVWVRGLASAPEALFAGKKRMSWVAMQGRFKQPLSVDSVVTGQEFARPFKQLPATWFVEKVLLSMARQISPSMRVGDLSAPYLLMPILAAAQLINVSKPGSQVPMMECAEDVRLFCPRLSSGAGGQQPASADARRRHFSSPKNRAGLVYDTENVWTFHFWQQFVDVASYRLDFGYTYDLVRHLDGQPMQVMAKDVNSGKYLYNVLMWHERLVAEASAAAGADYGGADGDSMGVQEGSGAGMEWS